MRHHSRVPRTMFLVPPEDFQPAPNPGKPAPFFYESADLSPDWLSYTLFEPGKITL